MIKVQVKVLKNLPTLTDGTKGKQFQIKLRLKADKKNTLIQ